MAADTSKEKKSAVARICGSTIIVVLHINGLMTIGKRLEEKLPYYEELQISVAMGLRYATVWNVFLQIFYAIFGIVLDLLLLLDLEWLVPSSIQQYRYTYICGLLFPVTAGITFIFWPIYFYDRQLIFPTRSDLIMTKFDNFLVHFIILVYVLWEVTFLPEDKVKPSSTCIKHIMVSNVAYILQIIYTRFVDLGIWPYDILTISEGSLAILIIFALVPVHCLAGYYLQFHYKGLVNRLTDKKHVLEKSS